jgi:glycosyl hydrolase family 26
MSLGNGTARRWWSASIGRACASTALLLAATFGSQASVTAAHAQAAQPILWGAYVDGVPWDSSKLSRFESETKGMSIIHWGEAWYRNGGYQPFFPKDFQTVRDHGSIPMLDWGSWEVGKGVNQPGYRLATIANGAFDAYIADWARGAAAWGHPLFLRFDWEMNGWWQFPWAEQLNQNQPGDYVRAWQHVHDIFQQQGAANVSWVWCPNISSTGTTQLAAMYPGDSYVDWTCMDGYNHGGGSGDQWQSFKDVFAGSAYNANHNTYQELLDVAPDKPIMIGETATSRVGGDPGAWVSDALTQELPNEFPQVKALVWFNWNAGDPNLTWPIESSPATQNAFGASIRSDYFSSNQFGSLDALAPLIQTLQASTPPAVASDQPAAASDDLALAPGGDQ